MRASRGVAPSRALGARLSSWLGGRPTRGCIACGPRAGPWPSGGQSCVYAYTLHVDSSVPPTKKKTRLAVVRVAVCVL
eukprot:12984625-Alexandrium_andersonii.AAC.1